MLRSGNWENADILHDIVLPQSQVSEWKEPVGEYNYFLYTPDEKRKYQCCHFITHKSEEVVKY